LFNEKKCTAVKIFCEKYALQAKFVGENENIFLNES